MIAVGDKENEEIEEEDECESDDSSALRPSSPGVIVYEFDSKSSGQNLDSLKLFVTFCFVFSAN